MGIIEKNQNKLIQETEKTGQFGIVVGNKVLVASKERVAQLALTYLMRNGAGIGVDKKTWEELPKGEL